MPLDLKSFLDFGGLGFLAFMSYIIFQAYRTINTELLQVIRNNTEAMARLTSQNMAAAEIMSTHDAQSRGALEQARQVGLLVESQAAVLAGLDRRGDRMEKQLTAHGQALGRVEQRLDEMTGDHK